MKTADLREYDLMDVVSQWKWDEIERTGCAAEPDSLYEKFMRFLGKPRATYYSVRFPIVPMHVPLHLQGGLIYMSKATFISQHWDQQYFRYIEDVYGVFWVARTVAAAEGNVLMELMLEYGRTYKDIVWDKRRESIPPQFAPRAKRSRWERRWVEPFRW
jgi:hypothetical protein